MPKASRRVLIAIAVLVLPAFLVACGSSDDSGSSSQTGSTQSTESTSKPAANGGICITALVGVGLSPNIIEGFERAGEANGLKPTVRIANPQGDLNSALENLRTCIQEDPKIITATGLENAAAATPIKEASEAGIAYIANYAGAAVPGVTASVSGSNAGQAEQLVKFTAENLTEGGDPLKVLVLGVDELIPVKERTDAFVSLAEKEGWDVTGPVQLSLADPAGSATQKVAAALASEDYDVISSPWSDPTAGTLAAIRQAGNTDVKVLDYDGDVNIFSQMEQGAPVVAVAGQPLGTMNKLRQVLVKRILGDEIPKGEVPEASCTGPVYTPETVPTDEEWNTNEEGVCAFEGKDVTSAEISKMAAE